MSYCRFSCDNWKSDVYCYEGGEGFLVHVAGLRVVGEIPRTPPLSSGTVQDFAAAHAKQMDFLLGCKRQPIDLPHAASTLGYDDADGCADGLEHLRTLGYHVPQHAIDRLREEAADARRVS